MKSSSDDPGNQYSKEVDKFKHRIKLLLRIADESRFIYPQTRRELLFHIAINCYMDVWARKQRSSRSRE